MQRKNDWFGARPRSRREAMKKLKPPVSAALPSKTRTPPASHRAPGSHRDGTPKPRKKPARPAATAATAAPAEKLPTANHGLYTKLGQLGEGSFGQIWLVRHNQTGETHVLKEIPLAGLAPKEVQATRLEVDVMRRIEHPSLIRFVNSYEEVGVVGILMEHASGGDLQGVIDKRVAEDHNRLPEIDVKMYALQLGSALLYIHDYMLLLHRDIKPANVFLSARGEVRLGDFGFCRLIPCSRVNLIPRQDARPPRRPSTRPKAEEAAEGTPSKGGRKRAPYANAVGTPLYMSPEHISGSPFDRDADVWAFGCTIYEAIGLCSPWAEIIDPYGGIDGGMVSACMLWRVHVPT